MEFIRNTLGNTGKLEEIHAAAIKDAESVDAAIAYATTDRPFLEVCWQAKKTLHLYARYDHTGPVTPVVLEWFLSKSKQSANYQLRLVPDIFHPKVIWWRKVGVYIGSANLTRAAWYKNYEAGVFLAEEELVDAGMDEELEDFFLEIHEASYPLTKEVADEMRRLNEEIGRQDHRNETDFNKSRRLPQRPSLISITRLPRRERKHAEFIREWNQTLQYLRDISDRLLIPGNNPAWIKSDVPKGVLADQFLHAYYYNQVRDGHRYPYDELYKKNCTDRDRALAEAIEWWRQLEKPPGSEGITIYDWAPKLRQALSSGNIRGMNESEFVETCTQIHAMREHAKQIEYKAFGLTHRLKAMEKEERVRYFAKWLFTQRSPDGTSPCELIDFVLYGGPETETPERLFSAYYEPDRKVPHIGVSALGEIVGWAMPDTFPPRNGRTSKALTALGYNVTIHSE